MPNTHKDISGNRFGRLIAVEKVGKRSNYASIWLCQCDCGNTTKVDIGSLNNGDIKSCGCYKKEVNGQHSITHGMEGTPIYGIWASMLYRCRGVNGHAYHRYGGRGITVCDRWLSFKNFYADMGERPEGKSLDRIDNDKGYSPENCRWATNKRQGRNRSSNRRITFNNETLCLVEWEKRTGISRTTIKKRISSGWSIERSLTEPLQKNKSHKKHI